MKKLIPALCMLLVSAILLGTSTFAWFSMNTQVSATGMQIKAQAEGGIVISNEAKSTWTASATASHDSVAELIPTSTADVTAWYHNTSDNAADAKAGQAAATYDTLTCADGNSDGVFTATVGTEVKNIYLLNKFYIKSSAAEAMTVTGGLLINEVTVSGTGTSAALDASLRVAIKIGGTVYIYAPVANATASYVVAGSGSTTTCKTTDKNVATSVTSIPGNATDAPVEAQVYLYFEGEDAACKSDNIAATLDTLQVSVRFGTTAIPTT
ncbi:MAG: hypothetical protein J5766_03265 [Clostridia bacterium]|nr:hypothetical protein [Clostridia bacterium]